MKKYLPICLLLLLCFLSGKIQAQESTITGKVSAIEDGSAITGVNVVIKGTTTGTITDIDGRYTIQVPDKAILVFSFIGYTTEEVESNGRSIIDVQLGSDVTQLSELVVTAVGVEREKKALGYAVQDITSDELVKTQTRSPLQSLQGKVAGVQIATASGSLGATTNVVLRGTSSLTGNNQALFIVDGVPINNSNNNGGGVLAGAVDGGNAVNDINPEDIASMTILKGASASVLYGSRAANGVVLITTKKGQDTGGKMNIEFNSSLIFERVSMLPELQNQFGQGQNGDNLSFLNDQESWGDEFDGSLRPYGLVILDRSSPFFNQQRVKPYEALENNIREFWEIGKAWNNSLSLSGGNENANFRFSISDLSQSGVVPETGLRRNTISISGGSKIAEKFDISATLNYVRQENDLAVNGQGGESPYSQVVQTSRSMSIIEQRDLSNDFNGVDWYYTPFIQNPYFNLLNDSYTKNLNRVYGSFTMNYKPIELVTLTARVGSDIISDDRKRVKERRIASSISPNSGADEPGFIQEEAYTDRQVDANFIASLNKSLTQDIDLNFLIGYNYNQRYGRDFLANVNATSIPGFDNISNSSANPTVTELTSKRRLMGLYSQLDLSYKGFLFLGANFRNDWSSTLPKDNRSFNYSGVNVSFVLTEAVDLGIEDILSFAKLRASYATVGNDAPPYRTQSVFIAPQGTTNAIQGNFGRTDFPLNGVPGFSEGNTIGNPNLKPELTTEVEFGMDLRFLKGRVGLDAAYFDKSSTDQIVIAAAAPASGFSFQVLNAGEIQNKGVELLLNGTPIKVGDFTWNVGINYTKLKNKVVSLNEGSTDLTIGVGLANYPLKAVVGEPYGVFQAPTALRDPNGNYIVDGNGLPQTAPNPEFFGNIQPNWLGGLTTSASYKGFTISATLERKDGGKVYSRTKGQIYFNGTSVETAFNDRERFIVPFSVVDNGDGTFSPNTIPLDYASNNYRGYWNAINNFGEVLIIDASYTKLRELSLTYSLPPSIVGKTPLSSATVSIFGRNLWIHTPDENTYIDPEVNSFTSGNTNVGNLQGFEFGTTPSTSTYGASIRVTL